MRTEQIYEYPQVYKAPGRINLIGEHTDYNGGFVLPAAIDKHILMGIKPLGNQRVILHALDINQSFEFDLNDEFKTSSVWHHYLVGVCKEMQKAGAKISGFECAFSGNIPAGAGMSSSAALECVLATALNDLFELNLAKIDLAKIAQKAEHNYVGTQCGLMDQFASMFGKEDKFIYLNCQSLSHRYFNINLGKYNFLLLNTNVSHTLASSEYNTRRLACEEGMKLIAKEIPNVHLVSDIDLPILNRFKDKLRPTVYNRCAYVLEENNRVLKALEAIERDDIIALGKLLYASHEGLSKGYEVSCSELDFIVNFCKKKSYISGGRMMGGGFGGCVLLLIEKEAKIDFIKEISVHYFNAFNIELSPYSISLDDGASKIKK